MSIKDMGDKQYTISDLCEKTGFSRRKVRYYVQIGLIDPPAGRGRGGFYYDSHLQKLLSIKNLQEQGLKLADILEYFKLGHKTEMSYQRETWIKYRIIAGFEIHIAREIEENNKSKIAEIIRATKAILKPKGDKNA